ncbi:hypothetical protein FOM02_29170 [Bradyrhizobium sp. SEMIA]|nr:hypothetical protein FOM02_29170 [Bradyrhizobium sp. SEMIA]
MAIVMPTKTGSAEAASMNASQQIKPITRIMSGGPRMNMAGGFREIEV